jgi:hypothetical protein
LLLFEGTFSSFSKDKKSQRSYRTVEIKVFCPILHDNGMDNEKLMLFLLQLNTQLNSRTNVTKLLVGKNRKRAMEFF